MIRVTGCDPDHRDKAPAISPEIVCASRGPTIMHGVWAGPWRHKSGPDVVFQVATTEEHPYPFGAAMVPPGLNKDRIVNFQSVASGVVMIKYPPQTTGSLDSGMPKSCLHTILPVSASTT